MRRISRVVATLASLVLVVLGAAPANAVSKRVSFTYGSDRTSWYWNKQVDEEAGAPGVPISQRVRIRSPQNADTLPVAVEAGKPERISALLFDLASRGLEAGSTITRATLTIVEETDRDEQPAFNTEGKAIRACRIDDFWPAGDAEKWETQPAYDESSCAEGKRNGKGDPPKWTFDITTLAQPWGADPFSNNGVMLVPVIPKDAGPTETWQINLKVPARDKGSTEEDEYRKTRDRAALTLEWTPGAEPSFGVVSSDFESTSFGPSGGGASFAPSTDAGTGPEASPPQAQAGPGPEQPVGAQPVAQVKPQPPWYVWLLLPLALLTWGLVRPLVLEPARGMRPDGAVAAIRQLNAERRGGPIEEPVDPLASALGAVRSVGTTARRLAGRAGRGLGGLAGSIARTVRPG